MSYEYVSTGSRNMSGATLGTGLHSTNQLEPHRQVIRDAVGAENILFNTTGTTEGDLSFRLPGHDACFRVWYGINRVRLYVGNGYDGANGAALLNEEEVKAPYGFGHYSLNTSAPFTVTSYASDYGFMFTSNWYSTVTSLQDYYMAVQMGTSLLRDEATNEVDPDKVLLWMGSYGFGPQYLDGSNTARPELDGLRAAFRGTGHWVRSVIYDLPSNSLSRPVFSTFPVMSLGPFPASMDYSQSQLYGVNTYAQIPPYPEAMLFKKFAADATQPGVIVPVGLDDYRVMDLANSAYWQAIDRVAPFQFGLGQGLLALKV